MAEMSGRDPSSRLSFTKDGRVRTFDIAPSSMLAGCWVVREIGDRTTVTVRVVTGARRTLDVLDRLDGDIRRLLEAGWTPCD